MATQIHYDDNIYYLALTAKTLKAGIQLEVDAEYFSEKAIGDVLFLDRTLSRLFAMLRDNEFVLRRNEYLKDLLRAKTAFDELIGTVLECDTELCRSLEEYFPRLRDSLRANQDDMQVIRKMIEDQAPDDSDKYVVSPAEFQGLLDPGDDVSE